MDKYTKLFLSFILIVGVGIGGYFLFTKMQGSKDASQQQFPDNPQKGDLGYQEPQTKVEIGTAGTQQVGFSKVENGNIYIYENGSLKSYPLTADEVVLACTSQKLEGARDLDYDAVTKVIISNPSEIGSKIPSNEPVVTFSQEIEGVTRVHTVAMSAEKCPLE